MANKKPQNRDGGADRALLTVVPIRKREDFLALRGGDRASTPGFLLVRGKSDAAGDGVRLGLTVTKKIGGAVVRNRIRRRLRAVGRAVLAEFGAPGHDYNMVARKAAYDRNYDALLDDLKRALLRQSRDTK